MRITDWLLGASPLPVTSQLDLRPQALAESYDINDPTLIPYLADGRRTIAGIVINEKKAMRNAAFNRAVRLICNAMGMLPVHTFKDVPDPENDRSTFPEKQGNHYLNTLLHEKPNPWMTPFEFKSFMVSRALLSSNGIAYALKLYEIKPGSRGKRTPRALVPLNPDHVTATLNSNWEPVFIWAPGKQEPRTIPWQDMFWFRTPYSRDGINGVSLIEVAAEALGLALTAEEMAGYVMQNGSIGGIVLEHPKALSPAAINNLQAQFQARSGGASNAGKVLVAEEGMKVTRDNGGNTLRDAQMIEQRKFQVEEIARFTDIPRPLLMVDETSWGSGIEQLGLFFITYCLMPWFVAIEEAVKRSLLNEEDQGQYYVKFNEGALLRGSLKDQAEFFSKALGSGTPGSNWMTQDEVRDKFNLKPKGGKADELATAAEPAPAVSPGSPPEPAAPGSGGEDGSGSE